MAEALDATARAVARLIAASGRSVAVRDRATGEEHPIALDAATQPDGLLPVLLAAGDAVWREATGHGLGVRIVPDDAALLGFRAAGAGTAPLSVVLLATLEAMEQAARPGLLLANDLNTVWQAATPLHAHTSQATPSLGPTP